jgi:DNA-binding NarL/FixJ family response regulator
MKCYGCVLLADNHLNMLAGARSLLKELFSVVVMVADEASLFEAVRQMEPDVVVVNLSLPVTGNKNIMPQLSSRYPGLKIIVLSVHDEPAAVQAAFAAEVSGLVLTRTGATDLIEAVRTVLEGRTYISPDARPHST